MLFIFLIQKIIILFGLTRTPKSVSYTHLDVYKRQTLGGTNIAFPTCTTSVVNPGVTTTGQADDTKDLFICIAVQYAACRTQWCSEKWWQYITSCMASTGQWKTGLFIWLWWTSADYFRDLCGYQWCWNIYCHDQQ